MNDSEKFCEFLLAHYPPARQWEDPLGYCCWNLAHGFMVVVTEDEKVIAMGVGRPVDRPGFGCLPYYYNENGSSLHIDLLIDISKDTRAINAMKKVTLKRFGPRETVAMFRHNDECALRVYDYSKFWDKLRRLKKKEQKYVTT